MDVLATSLKDCNDTLFARLDSIEEIITGMKRDIQSDIDEKKWGIGAMHNAITKSKHHYFNPILSLK